ncbi:hypothetical protein HHO41_21455 [Bacillus sp. DNRA2]|uniref:hypothetical protein n=1 Tax=Bacillus sp. DNRA2 TaxID=2723053 RepID=UPI00145C6ACA|nr:hypothetical protein [Bacillus sp. DNRA2]NMD72792.1 hypothetical protein [Bacillus sp. DNRA2]
MSKVIIKPHCEKCMKELKVGQNVVLTILYNIEHDGCRPWAEENIRDRGTFEEVVTRNRKYFNYFYQTMVKRKK